MIFRLASILLFWLLGTSLFASVSINEFYFRTLTLKDGLPGSTVTTIQQDNLGFMWIGTNDGLCRFDGTNFKIFKNEPGNAQSLSDNFIQNLFFDSENDLWVMTAQGLDFINLKQQKIQRIIATGKMGSIADNSPTDIVETESGTLYISSYYQGISYKKKNESTFSYINQSSEGKSKLSSNWITDLELINDSLLVIGYLEQGIDIFDIQKGETFFIDEISKQKLAAYHINVLQKDNQNGFWIGTNKGLSHFNFKTKKLNNYVYIENDKSFLADYDILSLFLDDAGFLWLGTRNKGLIIVNANDILSKGKNAEYISYTPDFRPGSLSYRSISSIFQDQYGQMWIGTHGGGINYVENKTQRFGHLQYEIGDKNSLSYSKVWGITEDKDGKIWIGTDGEGVNVWNKNSKTMEFLRNNPDDPNSISDNAIISAFTDYTGQVWLGTYNGGLNRFHPESRKFYRYMAPEKLVVNDVRCIYEDDEKNLWIGLNQGGVALYNREKDQFETLNGFNIFDIRGILKVKNSLWMGSYGQGLLKYDLTTGQGKTYFSGSEEFRNISPETIFSLCFTSDTSIWLGTRNGGLCMFNPQNETFKTFTEKDGLSNNTVHSILFEKPDNLWMSTNKGISRLNISTKVFTNFGWSSGVQSGEFHNGSGLITSTGLFLFGGINGLNYFDPKDLKPKNVVDKIHFTDLKILGEEILPEKKGVIEQSIEFNPVIHLNNKHSVFTIEFQSMGNPFFEDTNYEYYLENYDVAWNRVGKQNSATYRNLPPGNYVFRVKTYQNNEQVPAKEASLFIIMSPPFWKTWWAYLIYLFLAAGIVILIFRYRVQQFKIKNRLLYEQRLRNKEKKLHDERLEFFTNISHELRTPLTIIGFAIEELGSQKNINPRYKKSIEAASKNSSRLMELINRLLEFRQTETGVSSLKVRQVNLNIFIPDFLQGFREMAKHNQINLKLTLPINHVDLWVDSDKLAMILNNLLSNAFKHTPSGGQIILSIDDTPENIILKVEDSGKGISPQLKDKIFKRYFKLDTESTSTGIGLALTKALVELHQGEISLESNSGKGACFSVKFKKGYNHFSQEQLLPEENVIEKIEKEGEAVEKKIIIGNNEKIILLIDDNPEILDLLTDKFDSGYRILTAQNGKEGVELAREFIPNLIISDIMMPVMNGTELCTELKNDSSTSHIPIILLTAKGTEEDEIRGLNTGADDYISKPFKVSILQARVQSILENRIKLHNYFTNHSDSSIQEDVDNKTTKEVAFLKKVEDYVLENCLTSEVSVFDLAAELGYSRTTLYRKIKMLTDQSINSFVRSVKLKKSAELIIEGMNVSEAAYSTGFNDLKYFRESFKKMFGKNPSELKT
jgi:signal transduction histidine kinase/ligand-binding sensor domain-containing protein/DNA-binding NarL/FixJ family response regulator